MESNFFTEMYNIDVSAKVKQKNGLNYLSWAAAWAEFKKRFPKASVKIHEEVLTYKDTSDGVIPWKTRPWFDDGKTAWVKTSVSIDGSEYTEMLPIMDFKNKPVPAENVTSMDANKSIKRCMTKTLALASGIGLWIFEGEDAPEEIKEANALQSEVMALIKKKSELSKETAVKVGEICKELLPEENGDPRLCESNDKLKELKKKLLAVRKVIDK